MAAKERLKSRILRLLKEDEEFRYAVAGLIGLEEILRRLDRHEEEVRRIWQEIEKLREDMVKGFERHDREIERLREDMIKGFERHDRELQRLREDMDKLREDMLKGFELVERRISRLENLISALGAR